MIKDILEIYNRIKDKIEERINYLNSIQLDDYSLLLELFFCILTPQSKARNAGRIIEEIKKDISILEDIKKLSELLRLVRFKNHKALYINEAYNKFKPKGNISLKELKNNLKVFDFRDYLVKNVKGIGYKEASHFLRNIGLGKDIAILDRHILNIMNKLSLIESIPISINRSKYQKIENTLRDFSLSIKIPLDHIDFLFWYIKTNDIYK